MLEVKTKVGFTLVELALALAFVSVLSITVVLIINDTIATYRRGVVLNQVNTVGMDLVDDIRMAIQNSPTKAPVDSCATVYDGDATLRSNCETSGGGSFVSVIKKGAVKISNSKTVSDMVVSGTFCTGKYSYIWNSGYFWSSGDGGSRVTNASPTQLTYKKDERNTVTVGGNEFSLLKVRDDMRAVCIAAAGAGSGSAYGTTFEGDGINISNYMPIDDSEVVKLLSRDGENNMVLYGLEAGAPAASEADDTLFYSLSFILGTVEGGIDIAAAGDFCIPPGDYESNFDYCAINKFNFAVQATGE